MTDAEAINEIISLLEATVALVNQMDPIAQLSPSIEALFARVAALKSARGL